MSVVVSVVESVAGLDTPDLGDYSFRAYTFDALHFLATFVFTCILFCYFMVRVGHKHERTPPKKFNGAIATFISIWVLVGVAHFITEISRGFRGVGDVLYIQIDDSIFSMSWLMGMGYLLYLRKRCNLKTIEETLLSDKRDPVLYLRSFDLDDARFKSRYFRFPRNIPDFFFVYVRPFIGIGFDEYIQPELAKQIGPLIALGRPGDYLPMPGAARAYSDDSDWHSVALKFCRESIAIILLESVSDGVKWELEYIRRNCAPEKLFIITFPKYLSIKRAGWGRLYSFLKDCGIKIPEKDPGSGAILNFDKDWEAFIVNEDCNNAKKIVESIHGIVIKQSH